MELSYPSAQINKSVVSAIPPLGQVPCLMHQATAESILFIYRVLFAVLLVLTSSSQNNSYFYTAESAVRYNDLNVLTWSA